MQLVKAAKSGDTAAAQAAEKQWYANADKIADYTSTLIPTISKDEFKKMLYEHLALTKAEAVARLNKDYAKDTALYDQIETEALLMADMMTNGIVKQFPNIF